MQEFTTTQDSSTLVSEEISYLTLENKSLQKHLAEQQQQYRVKINEVASELSNTQKEMVSVLLHYFYSCTQGVSTSEIRGALPLSCRQAAAAGSPDH